MISIPASYADTRRPRYSLQRTDAQHGIAAARKQQRFTCCLRAAEL